MLVKGDADAFLSERKMETQNKELGAGCYRDREHTTCGGAIPLRMVGGNWRWLVGLETLAKSEK